MQEIVKVTSGKDLLKSYANTKPARPVFGNFIFENELSILFGDSNAGKSILANDIAFFVAGGGHKWEDMKSPKIPSLYIDMEFTGEQFARRYATAIDYIPDGYSRAEVTANTTENKWAFVRNKIISMQALKKGAPKFIVIDNITNGFGSIYSAKKMSKFVRDMKTLKERYGLTILLIAHCPKRNKRKPLDQDSLGGSKMLLNFVDSAFAIGTSLQDESVRYLKQVKCRECKKDKQVTTVQIKAQPYLSMWYVCDTDEESHTDPKSVEKTYYAFTPEEEMELVEWLTRLHNGENISYLTISILSHIPFEAVLSYDMTYFTDTSD